MSNLQTDVTKVEAQAVGVLAKNWYWVALGCLIVGALAGHFI